MTDFLSCLYTPGPRPFSLVLDLFTTPLPLHLLFSLYTMFIPVYSPGQLQVIFQDPETLTLFCEDFPSSLGTNSSLPLSVSPWPFDNNSWCLLTSCFIFYLTYMISLDCKHLEGRKTDSPRRYPHWVEHAHQDECTFVFICIITNIAGYLTDPKMGIKHRNSTSWNRAKPFRLRSFELLLTL